MTNDTLTLVSQVKITKVKKTCEIAISNQNQQVMSNPTAYPDIFEAIFIALDLEPEDLEACAQVSRSWRSFVMDYLWQSARVNVSTLIIHGTAQLVIDILSIFLQRHLDYKWSSKEPVCRSIQERNFARNNSAEVRCFSGYKNILLAGLYNGNIEVWRKGPITGKKLNENKPHVGMNVIDCFWQEVRSSRKSPR